MAFWAWRTAMGPLRAIVPAISVALARAWPAGTRWLMRPAARASSAFMRRPVKISSLASGVPRRRGRSWVPPMPGKMPSVVSGTPKTAVSLATMKSDRRASSQPPASAKPSTAAMTGTGQRSTRIAACSKITCWVRHVSSVISLRSLRSPPAQNARSPAPVNTMARASASEASAPKQARRSWPIAVFMALCWSGRLSVTVITWWSSERVTRRWRYTGIIGAGAACTGRDVGGLIEKVAGSLHEALGLQMADVVEGVAEPGEDVGAVLAELRGNAAHAGAAAVPLDRQTERGVTGQARVRCADQHAAGLRLRLLQHLVPPEDP